MVMTNQQISQRLREQASALAKTGDNLYRVRAFRRAALAVLAIPEEISAILTISGQHWLEHYPGIGKSLAKTIVSYVQERGEGTQIQSR